MKTAQTSYEIRFVEPGRDKKKPRLEAKTGKVIKSLRGRAVSFGTTEGPAFVLTNPLDFYAIAQTPKDAVLVCSIATPDLTAILPVLSALVTEHGGMLSVAAGAAREYAIPAVTGIPNVTALIKNGDIVRVDGRRGVVKVIGNNL